MKQLKAGVVVLLPFPQADWILGKLRPALVVGKLLGQYDDYLLSLISSQLNQEIKWFDQIVFKKDKDHLQTGLKGDSLIRVWRLAVVNKQMLQGSIGRIYDARLKTIKQNISEWILSDL